MIFATTETPAWLLLAIPDLQVYWDGTLLREEHFDKVIGLLYERRRSPLKRYGNGSPAAEPKP